MIRRAALLFEEVVVCVMANPAKSGRFAIAERLERLRAATAAWDNVAVDSHTGGLLVGYCRGAGIDVVIRGVRDGRDLDHEVPMVHMNRQLAGIETLFLAADADRAHISSTLTSQTTSFRTTGHRPGQ